MIRSALLARAPSLAHGLSTRAEGSVGPVDDAIAAATRAALAADVAGAGARLVAPHQVHGAGVAVIDDELEAGRADGVATTRTDVTLMVQGADCPLIALVDVDAHALALVHAGWRGTEQHVVAEALRVLCGLGASPERVQAAVFPGACASCFEVGPEVAACFDEAFGARARGWYAPAGREGHVLLDLGAAIAATLTDGGVPSEHIDRVPGCTMCGEVLFSHRASGGGPGRSGLFARLLG